MRSADCEDGGKEIGMQTEQRSTVKRGMRLAAQLPDIMPQQADAQIKPIHDDIQKSLRVPIVNLIFRTLANYPGYLQQVWPQLSALAHLHVFEETADALRAHALLESVPAALKLDVDALDNVERLRAFNDTIHYVLPKLLLVATALEKAPVGDTAKTPASDSTGSRILTSEVAEGTTKVEMVAPDQAGERVKTLFESIRQRHGHSVVSSYFRGLGNWPNFLDAVWERIAPYVGSVDYEMRKRALIDDADVYVRRWPSISAEVPEAQRPEISAIISAFRLKFIPEMLLDVALVKTLLDGREAARASRFSAAR
jgi:hypothetical protein